MFGEMGHKMTMKEARNLWGQNVKKLENNTFEFTGPRGERNVTLHKTIIMRDWKDGRYSFSSGDHRSNLTMGRLRKYAPKEVSIWSDQGNWYIGGTIDGVEHQAPFEDGIMWPVDVALVPEMGYFMGQDGDEIKRFIKTQCTIIARRYAKAGQFDYSVDRPPYGPLALAQAIKAKGRYPKPLSMTYANALLKALKELKVPHYVEAMLMARYGDAWARAERPGRHDEITQVNRRLRNIITHLLVG